MNSPKDEQKALGERIKEAREALELTQAEVAKTAKMTVNYYAMIERGEVNPSLVKIKNIVKALKLKITIS